MASEFLSLIESDYNSVDENTKKHICRTCALYYKQKTNLISIFDDAYTDLNDSEFDIIDELISLEVEIRENDDLPQSICMKCLSHLKDIYNFREICRKSQEKLTEKFKRNKENLKTSFEIKKENENNSLLGELEIFKSSPISFNSDCENDSDEEPLINKVINYSEDIKPKIECTENENVKELEELKESDEDDDEVSGFLRKCIDCKKYVYKNIYKNHKLDCHNFLLRSEKKDISESEICCSFCDQTFDKIDDIENHFKEIHPEDRPHSCLICKKNYKLYSEVKSHMGSHKENFEYKCNKCDKKYKSKKYLLTHIKFDHPDGDDTYDCSDCSKTFNSKSKLNYHINRSHSNGKKSNECEYCNKVFKSKTNFRIHLRMHTGEKPIICEKCGESFARKSNFNRHLNKVHFPVTYNCNQCEKSFPTKLNLKYHLERHNSVVREVRCTARKKTKNLNEPIFKCNLCPLQFILPSAFEKHMKVHDSSRKYPCSMCNCSYTSSAHLKRHYNRTHVEIKQYTCQFCNKSFRDPGIKKDHEKLHTSGEYQCQICYKIFRSQQYYRLHEAMHSGRERCECYVCGKPFNAKNSLAKHLKKFHNSEDTNKLKDKILKSMYLNQNSGS